MISLLKVNILFSGAIIIFAVWNFTFWDSKEFSKSLNILNNNKNTVNRLQDLNLSWAICQTHL